MARPKEDPKKTQDKLIVWIMVIVMMSFSAKFIINKYKDVEENFEKQAIEQMDPSNWKDNPDPKKPFFDF